MGVLHNQQAFGMRFDCLFVQVNFSLFEKKIIALINLERLHVDATDDAVEQLKQLKSCSRIVKPNN